MSAACVQSFQEDLDSHRPLSPLFFSLCRLEDLPEADRPTVIIPLNDGEFAPSILSGSDEFWQTGARVFASSAWLAAETVSTRSLWCATGTAAIGLFIGFLARRGRVRAGESV